MNKNSIYLNFLCNKVKTATFDQYNASLLNKIMNLFFLNTKINTYCKFYFNDV